MAGKAAARRASAGPPGLASTGRQPAPVLPHWSDPTAPWLCVEHRADAGARTRLDLRRLGFAVHWPRETVRIRGRDDVLRPFFPGYLFALPEIPNAAWTEIRHRTRDVICVVGVRELGRPAHPPHGFVLSLIERAGGAIDGVIPTPEDTVVEFRRGDTITMRSGPFAGMQGLFQEDRGKRVVILLEVLGVPRAVTVANSAIAKADH